MYNFVGTMKLQIINGPNLNLLGKREPTIYGNKSFETFFEELNKSFKGIELSYFQSNVEGEIINKLHEVGFTFDGVILNAGAYTHTSVAIADAIAAISARVIEVHISNVYAREAYRHQSLIAPNCWGVIAGFGLESYSMAISAFIKK
jgi:3-dehydroquinate dehydratase-2